MIFCAAVANLLLAQETYQCQWTSMYQYGGDYSAAVQYQMSLLYANTVDSLELEIVLVMTIFKFYLYLQYIEFSRQRHIN